MKLTSYRSTYAARGSRPLQFKFINLFNEHFPLLFFFKNIFSPKNWQGGGELLLQNRAIDGYAYDPFYSQVRFTFRGAPGTLGIIATSSCQI